VAFDLERAVSELVKNFASDKVFVDFILSRMFFSGLQVTQQVTSDRFGTGIGLFGQTAGTGRAMILLSPLGMRTLSFLPDHPIETLKLARLDLLAKIWVADRLMETSGHPGVMVAAYRMDPLGSGLETIVNELIRPNCDKSAMAVMFTPDVNGPVQAVFRPAMVRTNMRISASIPVVEESRTFRITVSNRKRLDWKGLLGSLSLFHKKHGIILSDIMLGGWDRSSLRFASFIVTTGSSQPSWPGKWRVRRLKYFSPSKGGLEHALNEIDTCVKGFDMPDVTPIFLHAKDGYLDSTYIMSPKMVNSFVSNAEKQGARTEMIELYDSEPVKPGKEKRAPGVVSLLQPLITYLVAPPVSMIRDVSTSVDEWAVGLLDFLKTL